LEWTARIPVRVRRNPSDSASNAGPIPAHWVSPPHGGTSSQNKIVAFGGSSKQVMSVCQPSPMALVCSGSLRTSCRTRISPSLDANASRWAASRDWSRKKITPCPAHARKIAS
jgi:hypothetical protein